MSRDTPQVVCLHETATPGPLQAADQHKRDPRPPKLPTNCGSPDIGIRIETLDNPGWAIDVRIADTGLEGLAADWHHDERSEHVWLHWRSTGQTFEARCGPTDLPRALAAFQDFATSQSSS
ncbi:MAG: Imm53 family immunity protein [Microbacteriaceae bacterium]